MKQYGLPYKGSKSTIAEQLINVMPEAECFVDLFCGGCAMTHAAMLSGKYKRFIANDIDAGVPQLFLDAVHGKYSNETRWISHEDFYALKDTDYYVKICWSFGNNGSNYLYSKKIEPWKKALHYATVFEDYSELEKFGIYDLKLYGETIHDRRLNLKGKVKQEHIDKYWQWAKGEKIEFAEYSLQSLESLERLERLERLESLTICRADYSAITIPENSVIYCDIPYENTDDYNGVKFEHNRFKEWALKQQQPIFISSYTMPEPFVSVFNTAKAQTLSPTKTNIITEHLYTTPRFANAAVNIQLDLFGEELS